MKMFLLLSATNNNSEIDSNSNSNSSLNISILNNNINTNILGLLDLFYPPKLSQESFHSRSRLSPIGLPNNSPNSINLKQLQQQQQQQRLFNKSSFVSKNLNQRKPLRRTKSTFLSSLGSNTFNTSNSISSSNSSSISTSNSLTTNNVLLLNGFRLAGRSRTTSSSSETLLIHGNGNVSLNLSSINDADLNIADSPLSRKRHAASRKPVRRFRLMYYDPAELRDEEERKAQGDGIQHVVHGMPPSDSSSCTKSLLSSSIDSNNSSPSHIIDLNDNSFAYHKNSLIVSSKIETFQVKQDSLPRVNVSTLVKILDGDYSNHFNKIVVIDCRFEYEYKGGHIDGALNISSRQQLEDLFIGNENNQNLKELNSNINTLFVFHCEFSSYRGPLMALHLRGCDRIINQENYPHLSFPNIVILDGGYKSFFQLHPPRCFPQCYVEMNDVLHKSACEKELTRFRKDVKKILTKSSSSIINGLTTEENEDYNNNNKNIHNNIIDTSYQDSIEDLIMSPTEQVSFSRKQSRLNNNKKSILSKLDTSFSSIATTTTTISTQSSSLASTIDLISLVNSLINSAISINSSIESTILDKSDLSYSYNDDFENDEEYEDLTKRYSDYVMDDSESDTDLTGSSFPLFKKSSLSTIGLYKEK